MVSNRVCRSGSLGVWRAGISLSTASGELVSYLMFGGNPRVSPILSRSSGTRGSPSEPWRLSLEQLGPSAIFILGGGSLGRRICGEPMALSFPVALVGPGLNRRARWRLRRRRRSWRGSAPDRPEACRQFDVCFWLTRGKGSRPRLQVAGRMSTACVTFEFGFGQRADPLPGRPKVGVFIAVERREPVRPSAALQAAMTARAARSLPTPLSSHKGGKKEKKKEKKKKKKQACDLLVKNDLRRVRAPSPLALLAKIRVRSGAAEQVRESFPATRPRVGGRSVASGSCCRRWFRSRLRDWPPARGPPPAIFFVARAGKPRSAASRALPLRPANAKAFARSPVSCALPPQHFSLERGPRSACAHLFAHWRRLPSRPARPHGPKAVRATDAL